MPLAYHSGLKKQERTVSGPFSLMTPPLRFRHKCFRWLCFFPVNATDEVPHEVQAEEQIRCDEEFHYRKGELPPRRKPRHRQDIEHFRHEEEYDGEREEFEREVQFHFHSPDDTDDEYERQKQRRDSQENEKQQKKISVHRITPFLIPKSPS